MTELHRHCQCDQCTGDDCELLKESQEEHDQNIREKERKRWFTDDELDHIASSSRSASCKMCEQILKKINDLQEIKHSEIRDE